MAPASGSVGETTDPRTAPASMFVHTPLTQRQAFLIAGSIATVVTLADWATKMAVSAWVPEGEAVEVGPLGLRHVKNPEMMLGLWGGLPVGGRAAIAVAGAVAGGLALYHLVLRTTHVQPRLRLLGLGFAGLAGGGFAGNLGERLYHWHVTDFLTLRVGAVWTPPANVADLALFGCMVVLVVTIATVGRDTTRSPKPPGGADLATTA